MKTFARGRTILLAVLVLIGSGAFAAAACPPGAIAVNQNGWDANGNGVVGVGEGIPPGAIWTMAANTTYCIVGNTDLGGANWLGVSQWRLGANTRITASSAGMQLVGGSGSTGDAILNLAGSGGQVAGFAIVSGPGGPHYGVRIISGANDCVVRNTTIAGMAGAGIEVVGALNTLVENATIRHNTVGVIFDGGVDHSLRDSIISSNSTGVYIENSSRTSVDGCIVQANRNGIEVAASAHCEIRHSDIENNNIGVTVYAGSSDCTVEKNKIQNNGEFGVLASGVSATVHAEDNCWGHSSGPYHPTENPSGLGDHVSDNVDFEPWQCQGVEPESTSCIEGWVWDEDTQQPINGAKVKIISGPSSGSDNTNSSGYYKINNLSPGSYQLQASKAGCDVSKAPATILQGQTSCTRVSFYLDCEEEPPDEICQAISDGIEWLVSEQNGDGSWGITNDEDWRIGTTAFVVLKLATHATDQAPPEGCGYGLESAFDPAYPYRQEVADGLDYLFAHGHRIPISAQVHDGVSHDPDTNNNRVGVYFAVAENRRIYNTGITMMAIAASQGQGRVVNASGSELNALTHDQVLQDAVDYLSFGQTDLGGQRGGWRYSDKDNEESDGSDNSTSGYAVMGLGYAAAPRPQGFGLTVPAFVKDELDRWIEHIQSDDGGSGYQEPGQFENALKTGNLLFEMRFVGDTASRARVQKAIDYLVSVWHDTAYCGRGWREHPVNRHQAMYCIRRGLGVYDPPIEMIGGIDWLGDFIKALLDTQNPDGSWDECAASCWNGGRVYTADRVLSTAWALLTLQPVPSLCGPMTISAQDVAPGCGETAWSTITVDTLPKGLAGYILTLSLEPEGCAVLTDIDFLIPGGSPHIDATALYQITFRDTDFQHNVQPGAMHVELARVEVYCPEGACPCETDLRIRVDRFEQDDGSLAGNPCLRHGRVKCTSPGECPATPFPGESNPPQDLDGDGDCEDVNGDGSVGFIDSILLHLNVGDTSPNHPINQCPPCFDFCCNPECDTCPCDGSVGFVDAVCHAWTEVGPIKGEAPAFGPVDCVSNVSAEDVTLRTPGKVATTTVRVDSLPQGLAGYIITLRLKPEGNVKFTGDVEFLSPGGSGHVDHETDYAITFRDIDINHSVEAGAEDIELAEVSLLLAGCAPPAADIQIEVSVDRLEDDNGAAMLPCVQHGTAFVRCTGEEEEEGAEHIYGAQSGWYMVSRPRKSDTEANPFAAKMYEWDPTANGGAGAYKTPAKVEPTGGYWAMLDANAHVEDCGSKVETDQTITMPKAGWYQIGCPWDSYPKSEIKVTKDGVEKSWADAVTANWVRDTIYSYKATDGKYKNPDSLSAWYGVWMKALVDGLSLELFVDKGTMVRAGVASMAAPKALVVPADLPPMPPTPSVDASDLEFGNYPNPVTDVHTTTFVVKGAGAAFVSTLKVQIFDLAGRLVYEEEAAGASLDWHTDSSFGEYLANGVYLYKLYALVDGEWVVSGTKKLAILR